MQWVAWSRCSWKVKTLSLLFRIITWILVIEYLSFCYFRTIALQTIIVNFRWAWTQMFSLIALTLRYHLYVFMLTLHLPAGARRWPASSCLSFSGNERRLCVASCLLCFGLFLSRKCCRQTCVLAAHACLCPSSAASHHVFDNWKRLHSVYGCVERNLERPTCSDLWLEACFAPLAFSLLKWVSDKWAVNSSAEVVLYFNGYNINYKTAI